jgi:hypothetical protein
VIPLRKSWKDFIVPVLFGLFMIVTIWSFLRNDPPATRLIYYVFDALFFTMLYDKYRKKPLHTFVLYVVLFGLITIMSFGVGGFTFLFVLIIDMPIAFLAYKAYSEIY